MIFAVTLSTAEAMEASGGPEEAEAEKSRSRSSGSVYIRDN